MAVNELVLQQVLESLLTMATPPSCSIRWASVMPSLYDSTKKIIPVAAGPTLHGDMIHEHGSASAVLGSVVVRQNPVRQWWTHPSAPTSTSRSN